MTTVLLVDDEEKIRALLSRIIGLEGYEVVQAQDAANAWKKLERTGIDVVICDVKLPDANGVALCRDIKQRYPGCEVIMLTAHGNIADGVQAMKNGAFDYITKGDDNDKILPLLARAAEKVSLQKRVSELEQKLDKRYSFEQVLGSSPAIKEAIGLAKKVAATDATVLLTGETGTGKEVFAQAIHYNSRRKNNNFLAINCSAFGKDLLESEIFGHKAGAFTGALKDKKGLIEEADKGTLFLDEIGEMNVDLQAKLLRVLETKEFIKVGDTKAVNVDVRIVAATNRNLQQEITAGRFREDLFYRLDVFSIKLPSLQERVTDIPQLAEFFAGIFAGKSNKKIKRVTAPFITALQQHIWKGNIRELKNIMERAVILEDTEELTVESLPAEFREQVITGEQQAGQLSAFSLASVEKLHIQRVLNHTGGNKTEAARLLNIGLTTLYRKIEEYKLA
ncbi:MAG TPA: sigma-54 dependent transcriptional regulator [Chitinophagaceae bacterium]|nr:sigma-54 dependent transcriptional regulator [Chitinophagaceae bacterium]